MPANLSLTLPFPYYLIVKVNLDFLSSERRSIAAAARIYAAAAKNDKLFAMPLDASIKIKSVSHLYAVLPEDERITVDVLRQIIKAHLPPHCREKISFNVPYFYGNKGICIVYPAFIPRGGIEKGVLLGFWHGNRLRDTDRYLTRGTNKQIFYKIYESVGQINEKAIAKLLKEAVRLDEDRSGFGKTERLPLSPGAL